MKSKQPTAIDSPSASSVSSAISPQHIAIIMDGNNRWAKKRLLPGVGGHKAGVEAIRNVLSVCEKYHVRVLTLFAFSSENWQRPEEEVGALMGLFLAYLKREVKDLHNKGIRIRFIGKRDRLSDEIVMQILEIIYYQFLGLSDFFYPVFTLIIYRKLCNLESFRIIF